IDPPAAAPRECINRPAWGYVAGQRERRQGGASKPAAERAAPRARDTVVGPRSAYSTWNVAPESFRGLEPRRPQTAVDRQGGRAPLPRGFQDPGERAAYSRIGMTT